MPMKPKDKCEKWGERAVVEAALRDDPGASYAAVADRLGLSRERVRQIAASMGLGPRTRGSRGNPDNGIIRGTRFEVGALKAELDEIARRRGVPIKRIVEVLLQIHAGKADRDYQRATATIS